MVLVVFEVLVRLAEGHPGGNTDAEADGEADGEAEYEVEAARGPPHTRRGPGEAAEGQVDEARHQPAAAAPPQPLHQAAAGHDGGEREPGGPIHRTHLQVQQQGQAAAIHR